MNRLAALTFALTFALAECGSTNAAPATGGVDVSLPDACHRVYAAMAWPNEHYFEAKVHASFADRVAEIRVGADAEAAAALDDLLAGSRAAAQAAEAGHRDAANYAQSGALRPFSRVCYEAGVDLRDL